MHKKYIVRLTEAERESLNEVIKKRRVSAQKVRRAQILLKADVDGPGWTDAKIAHLLARIFARLPEGGGLLIGEKLLSEDGVGPLAANMQWLNMLIVTEGRERSLGEYSDLLRQAGFADVQGRRTGVALDAILAVKYGIAG